MEVLVMSKQPEESALAGKRMICILAVSFVLVLGIGIGTVISYRVDATAPGDSRLKIQTDGEPVVGGAFIALSKAFEEVSNRIAPSVVNINTEKVITYRPREIPELDPEDPVNEFFRRFFPGPQKRENLGSGILVDPKGYIITNNHVVEGATKIKVGLLGGDEYTATVIGGDPVSDIAIIKINGEKNFPCARIGDSKAMKVGDWVIAVGSPFGLEQTVTAGIISTIGRKFKEGIVPTDPSDYSMFNDYLQTDAAINQGNSGGPLVNMNAEVVGINTFISTTRTGTSAGVGFAIPSHLFTKVYNQILQTGKVARGWVGVSMNRIKFSPAMAKFYRVKQGGGVLITQLIDEKGKSSKTGPAAKAGMKPEDVVVEFDGKKIMNNQDFLMAVANTAPGRKVSVKVVRRGQEKELQIVLAERQFEEQEKNSYSFESEKPKAEIGLEFDDVPNDIAELLEISGGAYVTGVTPGSLADEAGLIGSDQRAGDVIVSTNGAEVNNKNDLRDIIVDLNSGEPVVLKFIRYDRYVENRVETEIFYTGIIKP
jgi:serine protease Do